MNLNNNKIAIDDKFHRRFWILSLLSGVEEAGCSPIDLKSFNILAYIANAVADCYGISSLSPTVLKENDGPFYPELIWDLDRMVGSGLIKVSDIVVDNKNHIRHSSYSLTKYGADCLNSTHQLNSDFTETIKTLRSVALAYSRNRNSVTTESLKSLDGNYASPLFSYGQVIDFGDWSRVNATANSIEVILKELGSSLSNNPSIGVSLYSSYLASVSIAGNFDD